MEYERNLALINARFRKVLNFRSAQELRGFALNSCCTWFDNSLFVVEAADAHRAGAGVAGDAQREGR